MYMSSMYSGICFVLTNEEICARMALCGALSNAFVASNAAIRVWFPLCAAPVIVC